MRVSPAAVSRLGDRWAISWRIFNDEAASVELQNAWLPHSRFRAQEWQVDRTLQPGQELLVQSEVEWDGAEVQNAFLIVRLNGRRLFARLHAAVGKIEVEAVTYTGES